jgi:hypothetical protein
MVPVVVLGVLGVPPVRACLECGRDREGIWGVHELCARCIDGSFSHPAQV